LTLSWNYTKKYYGKESKREDTREKCLKEMKKVAFLMNVVLWFRDLLIMETIRKMPVDTIYSPSVLKIMHYQSYAFLAFALWAAIKILRCLPVEETFYPCYRAITNQNTEPYWSFSPFHYYYARSWALFFVAFLGRPSSSAFTAIWLYPLLVIVSVNIQKNWDTVQQKLIVFSDTLNNRRVV
jgi:hypothetical protein